MDTHLTLLLGTAASIGLIHTVLGPDHYIPFVAMAKAGNWSRSKMLIVTVLCGIGHVASSVIIGLLGVALGWAVEGMELVESMRGQWTAWALIAFGLAYGIWGVRRALRNRPHAHDHAHADGTAHMHSHGHEDAHAHAHLSPGKASLTPWILFTIFVFGPCEPLIPLLIVPAAQHSWWGVILVSSVFSLTTVATMTGIVLVLSRGIALTPMGRLERWSHALAGFAILACGAGIQWLGF